MATRLKSRIPLIIGELDDKLREGVEDFAERVSDGAKERVPVDSGALRDAIHVEVDGMTIRVVAGDSDVFYGHLVEGGSINTPPRPFLIPAYEAERQGLDSVIRDKLRGL